MMQMLSRLDNWTLLVCIALATSASAFAFGRTWQTQERARGAGAFALAFLSGTLSCVLFTALSISTAWARLANIVVGDTLVLCVYAFLLTGIEQFFGVRRSARYCWVLVGLSSVLLWVFTFPSDSLPERSLVMCCCTGIICAAIGVEMVRHPGRRHLRTMSTLMFLYVGVEIAICYRTIFQNGPNDWYGWMHSNGPQQLVLLTTVGFLVAVSQLLFLLLNGELVQRLAEEATRDYVTGLLNRRGVERALAMEMERSRRYGTDLSIGLVDIDRFKEINDTRGHAEGDQVLVLVAQTITKMLRSCDLVGRFGGDEFLVILPSTSIEETKGVMDRLRETMVSTSAQTMQTITLSIGVTSALAKETKQVLLARADEALYEAKESGRDRTRMR